MQKITITGNVGRKPEMRYLKNGTPVTNFSVATNRKWDGGEETIWFKVSAWDKRAENCYEYLDKGSKVYIEGRLKPDDNGNPRIWHDAQGNPRASFEINALYVEFLSSPKQAEEEEDNIEF